VESVRSHLFDQLERDQLEALGVISRRLLEHLVAIEVTSLEDVLGDLGPDVSCAETDALAASAARVGSETNRLRPER
jgi:hypothetical protein